MKLKIQDSNELQKAILTENLEIIYKLVSSSKI